jgi:DNA mismatch repair protein MutS
MRSVKNKEREETPLMKQYYGIKAKHPDALLLFRVGDFYETFGEDAKKAAKILNIVLTSRANGSSHIELAGFPYHSLETYLPKLVKAGMRVAVCEQLEDPKKTKKIVKRGVTELVSPGTSISENILDKSKNNYLAALHFGKEQCAIALIDFSTGEFNVAEGSTDFIENLLNTFKPTEIIYSKEKHKDYNKQFSYKSYTYQVEDWLFSVDYAYEKLLQHFHTKNLKGYGIEEMNDAICAAGVIIHYFLENKYDEIKHINQIGRIEKDKYVWIDKFTARNIELLETQLNDGIPLIRIIDHAITPMGSRLLRKWISMPLKEIRLIKERLNTVEYLIKKEELREKFKEILKGIGDIERLISKIALKKINPRELLHVSKALEKTEIIKKLCMDTDNEVLHTLAEQLNPCQGIKNKIDKTLDDEPPVNINKGDLIREGVNSELDSLKDIKKAGKNYLVQLKEREIEKTGISSLKIGYNNVFGYYLEITNKYKDQAPSDWIRKQTLSNAERYITPELKEYEDKILHAEERISELEQQIYLDLLHDLNTYIEALQMNARLIAYLDCILSFSFIALENNYCKPQVDEELVIDIRQGRHPVIEKNLPDGESYIPNDIYLNNENQQIIILTGPNMSGKSAVLRQTALIVLLAQTGSYVPAETARIGIVDKIFTRVGASDNLSMGESTFMVEMLETASILNNLSRKSLILLDEIGRGTSTYDGISLAWAITEFLHQNTLMPKTIFATHYHELNEIASSLKRVRNFNVSVKEYGNKVVFLRKLKPGGSEHSFGIHVARMAGVPPKIVERAKLILEKLESQRNSIKNGQGMNQNQNVNIQLKLFEVNDPVYEVVKKELNKIDVNSLTPIEALMKINHLKSLLKNDKS